MLKVVAVWCAQCTVGVPWLLIRLRFHIPGVTLQHERFAHNQDQGYPAQAWNLGAYQFPQIMSMTFQFLAESGCRTDATSEHCHTCSSI